MSSTEITVAVHGGDPLSRAGLISHLAHQDGVTVLVQTGSTPEQRPEDVAVALLNQMDATASKQLRKLVVDRKQRVVLVVDELDEAQLEMVLEAGVPAIVWRHQATAERLVKAIRAVGRGEGEVPGDLLRRLLVQLGRTRRGSGSGPGPTVSPTAREIAVLKLVAKGMETREIAAHLCYSERTVKGVLHDVMVRLHLKNRAHAVAFAMREGYL
ncbi:LuxR C-terminal-related transcriptional regulator [Streptomyces sp. NPDC090052]|uniref:helix-turn-helix transcriptional regulator n=1 Tax=unclassified Streptomyces TaxID=2593676 RepID=UPI002255F461|nr:MULTISPECIES: response regulator transcription factor [unclassified Streptomyces]MCX4728875.1 response regulator transcription factor [Streptomyces sp. NBC_01306]WSV08318.1 response regulator transcription factor [Streptomyces sp. NBC_01020]WSX46405.1 response regulator transcription factor [Streptomyces sp. NBC_00963]WSX65526.1 response regulator transcription factor [Streptomyces sp. NBC_00932]